VGVAATLEVDGLVVTLPDSYGGTFNAAGDFDRLLRFRHRVSDAQPH
jgi:hypothetical protein